MSCHKIHSFIIMYVCKISHVDLNDCSRQNKLGCFNFSKNISNGWLNIEFEGRLLILTDYYSSAWREDIVRQKLMVKSRLPRTLSLTHSHWDDIISWHWLDLCWILVLDLSLSRAGCWAAGPPARQTRRPRTAAAVAWNVTS